MELQAELLASSDVICNCLREYDCAETRSQGDAVLASCPVFLYGNRYKQLTGTSISARNDASPESQLIELKTAGIGKRWLVVLDGIVYGD